VDLFWAFFLEKTGLAHGDGCIDRMMRPWVEWMDRNRQWQWDLVRGQALRVECEINLEEPIGYPAQPGLIHPSVCPSVSLYMPAD
jgi:hypothetical protein